ncbi:MAG TPA: SH3 domain-containing protein [Chloroflexi bacterium]|nr:SH3 domain-containing protein [Chloroflexota bacterium]
MSATTGPILRERREAMGVTLAEAEVATRIRQKYLAALESDEWDLLPGEVVGRGFLRNYSTYLGIDPTEMIERRRAIADESLAAVLADTSAGSPLPPERAVDYRPKDVALHEETVELEAPRRINVLPFVVVLAIAALAGLVWWSVTQFGNEIENGIAAAQAQIALWQQPAPTPAPTMTEAAVKLPENLVAAPVTNDTAPAVAAGATVDNAAASAPPEAVAPTVAIEPTPQPVVAEQAAAPAISLAALLPTPTPQAVVVEAAPAAEAALPATVITAANLRQAPSTEAPIVGAATEGETLTIVGQTADGAWFQLESGAWIFAQLVNNPPANIPVVEAPPTVTAP